jgi:DNA-binding LacI/PurR family transcriptional regulator
VGGRLSLRTHAPTPSALLDDLGVTAILAPNDYFAHQYYHWLRAAGLRLPEDVSLLSFDNNRYSLPFSISSIDFGFGDLVLRHMAAKINGNRPASLAA